MRRGGQEGGKRGKKQGFVGGKRKVTPTGYVETSTPGATIGILFSRAFPRIWPSSAEKCREQIVLRNRSSLMDAVLLHYELFFFLRSVIIFLSDSTYIFVLML